MSCSSYLVPICTLAACGCTSQYMEIGNNWISTNERVAMIDTCSVDISSIRIDSVQTSGGNAVYAGCRESPYWGRTDISSYLTFKATEDYEDSSTPEYEERIIFDSLTLYMVPDSTFCGDTLLPMTYQVYRLSETVEPDDDNVLYSHHEFSFNPDPVAEKTFYPHPFRGRAVEIRLSDELGEEMLGKIVDGDEEMTDDDSFREYFNGLLLKSAGAPGSISGFKGQDTLCMMKLYYRTQDYAEPEEHVLEFHLDSTYLFNHVESDYTGTPLAALEGSYCKQNYSSLPSTVNLYIMDENNISTGGAITASDGETLQSGSLTYDEMMFPESTYYTYDITDFINDQFGKIGVNKNYLQMTDPDYGYTLDELITADRYTSGYRIKLVIKLALYDE